MEVTKLEHACLVVAEGGSRLVVDPGGFTRPVDSTDVVAVVITHEHPDHASAEHVHGILERNPGAVVLGPPGVARALGDAGVTVDVVADGDHRSIGPFVLDFHGTRHNRIHETVPVVDNTGVLVNGVLFHPGDSYTVPGVRVEVLAAPLGAPWLQIGDAMDYVAAIAPRRAFPIHEATLSEVGRDMHAGRLREAVAASGELVVLAPGDQLTV